MTTQTKQHLDKQSDGSERKTEEANEQNVTEQGAVQETQSQPLSKEQLFWGGLIQKFSEEELDFLEDMGYL